MTDQPVSSHGSEGGPSRIGSSEGPADLPDYGSVKVPSSLTGSVKLRRRIGPFALSGREWRQVDDDYEQQDSEEEVARFFPASVLEELVGELDGRARRIESGEDVPAYNYSPEFANVYDNGCIDALREAATLLRTRAKGEATDG